MTAAPVHDTAAMIAGMDPVLRPGRFAFVAAGDADPRAAGAFAVIREDEAVTLVLPEAAARGAGPLFSCITLMVHSALEGVGLTAAVSVALAGRGIPCNVIAGVHHDHLFVPAGRAEEALATLQALRDRGGA